MVEDHENLIALKVAAKVLTKRLKIQRYNALDMIAQVCDFPRWTALTKAYNKGWRPSWVHMERAENLYYGIQNPIQPRDTSNDTPVEVRGHKCTLTEDFMDVLIWGERWCIHLGHAPSEPAEIEKHGACAIDDPDVLAGAMKLLLEASDALRQRIKDDWPAQSFTPDENGRMSHPLMANTVSSDWYCLHCDGKHTSAAMAANMWHCPKCSATPIDIFPEPFLEGPHEGSIHEPPFSGEND